MHQGKRMEEMKPSGLALIGVVTKWTRQFQVVVDNIQADVTTEH